MTEKALGAMRRPGVQVWKGTYPAHFLADVPLHTCIYILVTQIPHPHGQCHLQALLGNTSYHKLHPAQTYLSHPDLLSRDLTYF